MGKYEYRRRALQKLINTRFGGVIARFADATDMNPSYVSRMLYEPGKAGRKNIGEDTIEKVESALSVPGYFSPQGGIPEAPAELALSPEERRLQELFQVALQRKALDADAMKLLETMLKREMDRAPKAEESPRRARKQG